MNLRRFSSTTAILALLAASGVLSWWLVAPPAHAEITWNTAAVFIEGTVFGQPENVAFQGKARIKTRLALDPEDSFRSKILLQFDLSAVTGMGATTAATYVIDKSVGAVHRPLSASDVIDITFPFHTSGEWAFSSVRSVRNVRNGHATFTLGFDTTTGVVTAAKASISDGPASLSKNW